MSRTFLKMLVKTVDDFQSNSTQQLPYVIMAFRRSVHESSGYTPVSCFWRKNQPPHWYSVLLSRTTEQDWYASVCPKKRADTQRAEEAARLQLQASQLRRSALYISKTHDPRYKPGNSVWLRSSVTHKGLSPKLSSPCRGPFIIVQCLNDVTFNIKNTANQKELIVHYDRLKPFIQRPEKLPLPRREPSLPRELKSKSEQKPHSAFHQHCNCSLT